MLKSTEVTERKSSNHGFVEETVELGAQVFVPATTLERRQLALSRQVWDEV